MDEYILNYNTFEKKAIYIFNIGHGGLGDYIKYLSYALHISIKNNIRLYISINHSIDNYIKLKYPQMYININNVNNKKEIINIDNLIQIINDDSKNIKHTETQEIYYYVYSSAFYTSANIFEICNQFNLNEIFYFTDEIKQNALDNMSQFIEKNTDVSKPKILKNITKYISIHLRMGDHFLETDKQFVVCKNDVRNFDETKLYTFIEQNSDKNIMFFCDNKEFKIKLKQKYNFIHITDFDIGHVSFANTSDLLCKNCITEFYMLSQSETIYILTCSGFSLTAANFKNIECKII